MKPTQPNPNKQTEGAEYFYIVSDEAFERPNSLQAPREFTGRPARGPHAKQRLHLLEDIQSHDNRDPEELSNLDLLLKVTAAVCHQLDVLLGVLFL